MVYKLLNMNQILVLFHLFRILIGKFDILNYLKIMITEIVFDRYYVSKISVYRFFGESHSSNAKLQYVVLLIDNNRLVNSKIVKYTQT